MIKKFVLPLLMVSFLGCLNNVEDVTGEVQLDVSFTNDVQPILDQHCISCHNSGFANNNSDLSSYSAIFSGTGAIYGNKLVVPNFPDSSGLVDKIEPNPDSGGRMPTGGPFLSGDEIQTIRAWINEGALNN